MSKYPRTYHIPSSEGTTSDDKISNNIDSLLNVNIVITEKLDGSNTSITKNGVYGRSHVDFSSNPWDKKSWEIWKKIKDDLDDNTYIFGEGMYGIHSIEYSNLKSYFYIFGIKERDLWLSWDETEDYSYLLDIPTVPILFKGVLHDEKEMNSLINKLTNQKSKLGGELEGIVIRNSDSFFNIDFKYNVMKWVRKNHVKTDIHWTRNWKKSNLNY